MEGLPSAKTIKFKFLQLGQTLLSRPSFCNEKLLAKAAICQYSSKKNIIIRLYSKILSLCREILERRFISRT